MNEFLIDKLPSLFTPQTVLKLNSEVITRVAGESEQTVEERKILDKKLAALREAQKLGYRMQRHKPQGMILSGLQRMANNSPDLTLRRHLFDNKQKQEDEEDEDEEDEEEEDSD
jgi:hypothetical protein